MKLTPKKHQVVGRIVDFTMTKGGIVMPDTQMKGVTVFVLLDAVGSEVTDYKPGDVVLPHHINHVYLRGGSFHRVIFEDKDILATIEDLPMDLISIDGKPVEASTEIAEVEQQAVAAVEQQAAQA